MTFDVETIRTEIITPEHDLVDVVRRYTRERLRPGDVVAVSTKIVSITQGRLLRPEDVRPGLLARLVSRFIDQEGSCSSPHSLQAVIERTGRARVALAFVVAGCTRLLLGRSGDFYRIAGYQARVIDDVMGTMPPFDKHIILPPADPDGVAKRLARALGRNIGVCIVDANDLGRAEIVGASPGVDRDAVLAVMRSNPWGNADQQSPLAILRPRSGRSASA
ncbi:MAG TPA: coenzyme F420-0:L-glutamate ligase [Thermaerobacter sp.]